MEKGQRGLWPSSLVFALFLFVAAGCATPIGVRFIDPEQASHSLTRSIVSGDELSAPTVQLVNRLGLANTLRREPSKAIATLHSRLIAEPVLGSELLFALAEVSFLHAVRSHDRSYYLAAALYAYAFLFPGGTGDAPPGRFDPRLRLGMELYNRAITEGLTGDDGLHVTLAPGSFSLPFGELRISLDSGELTWGSFRLTELLPSARMQIRGLRNKYRWTGIGAPLVARTVPVEGVSAPTFARIPEGVNVSLTAFLRFFRAEEGIRSGKVESRLEVFTTDEATATEIEGQTVPIEYEMTSTLAYSLEGSRVYRFEISGFFKGDLNPFKDVARFRDGVFLTSPYKPGRIPVVLVHGTASSPARWAEMTNELVNDPDLWGRYQFWFFTYNTGNPILYSAGVLAEGLQNVVNELDPEGKDPALRKMVIIGHSQGGILARLTVSDSGSRFWDAFFTVPYDDIDGEPGVKELIRRSTFFSPLPFVERVIFIATPHGGSFVAGSRIGRWAGRLVSLPVQLLQYGKSLVMLPTVRGKVLYSIRDIPRSTDDMSPGSRFLEALKTVPISPSVKLHSIIPVANPKAEKLQWNDGVVSYYCAHLDGASSELVVRSGHSTQSEPATIEEVRRILLEHARHEDPVAAGQEREDHAHTAR